MNSNPWTGSSWSPAQTRPRLFLGSPAPRGACDSPAAAGALRPARPSSGRPGGAPHHGRPGAPSSGCTGPTARTAAPAPRASVLCEPARRCVAGTPVGTTHGSSASWMLLSAPTLGCPRNRVNSTLIVPAARDAQDAACTLAVFNALTHAAVDQKQK